MLFPNVNLLLIEISAFFLIETQIIRSECKFTVLNHSKRKAGIKNLLTLYSFYQPQFMAVCFVGKNPVMVEGINLYFSGTMND